MNKYDIVKLKNNDDLYGIVMIPSKLHKKQIMNKHNGLIEEFRHYSLNNVWCIDDSIYAVGDDDLELINDDRTKEFNSEIEKLYD